MSWYDFIKDLSNSVAVQAGHKAEVGALNAQLKLKDATIENKDQQNEFLREQLSVAQSQRQSLSDSFEILQINNAKLDSNLPPTLEIIADSTATTTFAIGLTEKLGSTLDEMSDALAMKAIFKHTQDVQDLPAFRKNNDDDADPD